MTCREFADFILEYASGELPLATRHSFERHLSVCPNCGEYLAQYLAAVELGRSAFVDQEASAITAGVPRDLVLSILAARSRSAGLPPSP